MKKLSTEKRAAIVRCLVEGCSIRATCRMMGVSKNTVAKLLVDMGEVCRDHHDENVRRLHCQRIQADEIWSFVGCKEKAKAHGASGEGDVWTWTALDPDTKLMVSYIVGPRDGGTAFDFMHDLAGRLLDRGRLVRLLLELELHRATSNAPCPRSGDLEPRETRPGPRANRPTGTGLWVVRPKTKRLSVHS